MAYRKRARPTYNMQTAVHTVMCLVGTQKYPEFRDLLRNYKFLQKDSAAWHGVSNLVI